MHVINNPKFEIGDKVLMPFADTENDTIANITVEVIERHYNLDRGIFWYCVMDDKGITYGPEEDRLMLYERPMDSGYVMRRI